MSGDGPGRPDVGALSLCLAAQCQAEVPPGRNWCARHYALIPAKLKARLWHATGGEHARLLSEARDAVETAEFGGRLL